MHVATALAAGLATLNTATAFLIPPKAVLPNLQAGEEEVKTEIAHLFGLESTWKVELDCPNCPWGGFTEGEGKRVQWSTQYETTLVSRSASTKLDVY